MKRNFACRQVGKIYFALFLILVIGGCFLLTNFVQAIPALKNPLGTTDISKIAGKIIETILGIVGILALVMFIYGGILWMTSGGSAEKIKKGKDTIVWAIFGIAFIFLSYAILDFILKAFIE